jgi:cation diffusion facilitator CzcD-associated flavoprotein CzcO
MPRRILIIGSGFGGLGLGIQLKRRGIDSFTILEKAPALGGTWRENTYPGAACDVPSLLYSYSFEPKTDWTRKWSPQAEIREYMEHCARKYGILPHVRFGVEVAGARFDEASGTWTVRTTAGEELVADVLVSGVGQLHHPSTPSIPGMDRFRGIQFHSARWNHDVSLAGKRVAVVGNAASAIQFIPEIAPVVSRLLVFQRSANWMFPRGDRAFTPWEHWVLAHVPGAKRFARAWRWAALESLFYPLMRRRRLISALNTRGAIRYMESIVTDPALRRILVPDYPIGGKRVLITDGYYEALVRENVTVVTDEIDRLTEDAIVTRDGTVHPVDAVVYATGFRTNPFLAPMRIEGLGGRLLADEWVEGAHAYYGLTVSGFPNFFMLYGPNTNLGHNSIIFMMEAQMRYVLSALDALESGGLRYLDLRRDVMDAFNAELQAALRETAWAAAGASWYKDAAGRITNNWPWSTLWYWWKTRRIVLDEYRAVAGRAATSVADARGAATAPAVATAR